MKISYNAAAMYANNAANMADNRVSQSLKRLSSGLKITSAKDNPSGYAIGRRMNAQIGGLSVATRNSNRGINIVETADGALTEVHEMLQRMNELAIKGAHGVLTTDDREMVNAEMKQLKEEITRISTDTEFNGQTLLDGSFDLRGYTNSQVAKVDYYSDEVLVNVYEIDALTVFYNDDGTIDLDATSASFVRGANFPSDARVTAVGQDKITITASQDFEITIAVDLEHADGYPNVKEVKLAPASPAKGNPGDADYVPAKSLTLDITGIGSLDLQTGANEGQQLRIRIPTISLDRLGIERTEVTTEESSSRAITEIKGAIQYVSDARSRLGAYQNRLEHTINNLDVSSENMTASYSNIMDVDMAEEMTTYTTQQVIAQAAVSMLAQANERPSQVLQLLQ
ncbi:MAG: flagellin [Lachnospiraceae bacterium]|nr:flagellin [Lachnospiraceae bacterium]